MPGTSPDSTARSAAECPCGLAATAIGGPTPNESGLPCLRGQGPGNPECARTSPNSPLQRSGALLLMGGASSRFTRVHPCSDRLREVPQFRRERARGFPQDFPGLLRGTSEVPRERASSATALAAEPFPASPESAWVGKVSRASTGCTAVRAGTHGSAGLAPAPPPPPGGSSRSRFFTGGPAISCETAGPNT